MQIPVVMCGKCGLPVEELDSGYDRVRRVFTFTASCHGEVEHAELREEDFQDSTMRVVSAEAFQPKKEVTHAA